MIDRDYDYITGVNPSGRYEPTSPPRLRRWLGIDRGAAALQDRGAGREAAHHHHPQRIAGHLLRPLDQSLSRLRAWLRLLLRAADARLYGPVAGARFRDEAVRQAECRAAAGDANSRKAGYQPRTIAIGTNTDPYQPIEKQYRIMREILEVLERARPSGRHRHQVGAGDARHRHTVAHGRTRAGQGGAVGDDARPASWRAAWSRARRRRRAAGGDPPAVARPACRRR